MFWDDIREIKLFMDSLTNRLVKIDHTMEQILGLAQEKTETYLISDMIQNELEIIKEGIEDAFSSEDENNSINRIHDKLNVLIKDVNREKAVLLAEKTIDKFEEYMKNVEKLNIMINEFKGCVSMSRAAIGEGKDLVKEVDGLKGLSAISLDIYNSMISFVKAGENIKHVAHYKIDAIYKAICENEEKKAHKKKKTVKQAHSRSSV